MGEAAWYGILQYEGAAFAGWQRQPDQRTVQSELETGLARLARQPVVTHAAGRTDAGVHALGQVVSFSFPDSWSPVRLRAALDAVTPPDLWIAATDRAPLGFHARRHAVARRYRYIVGTDPAAASPFRARHEWALTDRLDPDQLDAAAAALRGRHDFRSLATTGQAKPHYECTIGPCEWQTRSAEEGYIFTVQADRFLHRMVRFMVGIMVDVARGRRPLDDIPALLAAHDNREASPPAPPHGLFMLGALYDQPELGQIDEFVARQ